MSRRRAHGGTLREEYAVLLRRMCAMSCASLPTCPWPAQLAALEAGERVVVQGWEVGDGRDFNSYWLEPDGSLTPSDPPRVDPVDPNDVRTLYERTHPSTLAAADRTPGRLTDPTGLPHGTRCIQDQRREPLRHFYSRRLIGLVGRLRPIWWTGRNDVEVISYGVVEPAHMGAQNRWPPLTGVPT